MAQYCAELSNGSNDRYSEYLLDLPIDTKPLQRLDALNAAGKCGLNVFEIAVRTAEETTRRALEALPRTQDLVNHSLIEHEHHSTEEQYLIRSLEWVVNYRDTYDCASRLASRCIRYFLCEYHVHPDTLYWLISHQQSENRLLQWTFMSFFLTTSSPIVQSQTGALKRNILRGRHSFRLGGRLKDWPKSFEVK